jgi:phosphotriesterase-related protein
MAKHLQTITGPAEAGDLGLILPHEHLFTDLRGPTAPGYAQAEVEHVVGLVGPYIQAALAAGVTAMVECSTVGVGRKLAIQRRLADLFPLRIVVPTGIYKEAYTPASLRDVPAEYLAELWTRELSEGIEGTPVRAGFIKLAMSDDGPKPIEIRNLKAAASTSRATGAVIASHTIGGTVAHKEMDVLAAEGLDLHRFIWVHAQSETNRAVLLAAARRGAYVELDSIGASPQSTANILATTLALLEAGYSNQILLSHDAGWYNPGRPDGLPGDNGFRGYTTLVDEFLPALKSRGVTDAQLRQLTAVNPFNAFAF